MRKTKKSAPRVLVVHGPNLNMLGLREPEVYGRTRLTDIDARLDALGRQWGLSVTAFQSNHEGAIVDKIQASVGKIDGLIINPAAYTHTSIAIRDAIVILSVPIIEVHISNIHKREPFRHRSLMADVITGQIVGLGVNGYYLALRALADIMGATTPA
jgi:3-dehydroquinate dehydratase II